MEAIIEHILKNKETKRRKQGNLDVKRTRKSCIIRVLN